MGEQVQTLYFLMVALAIGLLVGVERGWQERDAQEGQRIAGVRTYGLIGLLGGGSALLAQQLGALVLGLVFVALAIVMSLIFLAKMRQQKEWGITSLVAGLLTFILAALATMGQVVLASAGAVVTVLLLSYKPVLHRWISGLQAEELRAGIKLLLISVVLLPILPNQGYGPWQALNPYEIWWMVVLIAMISFVGYFAIKIGGARKGILFTGLFGGLASSTAVTLSLSRLAHRDSVIAPVIASGILIACGTMFIRLLLIVSILNLKLFFPMLVPVLVMALLTYIPVLFYWHQSQPMNLTTSSSLKNPLELKTALTFGFILTLVMLLSVALREQFGDVSLLTLAAVSGITDVDAITLSLVKLSHHDLALRLVVMGVVIAASMNNLLKAGMSVMIGGSGLGLKVAVPLLISALGGIFASWLWIW